MGLLTEGTPLSWSETKKYAEHVQKHGIQQFINLYHKLKDRHNDGLKWGDEIEYILVHFDDARQKAQVALKSVEVLPILQRKENEAEANGAIDLPKLLSLWRPECGAYMVESSPGEPFGSKFKVFNEVEPSMRYRRQEVQSILADNEAVLTFCAFPRIGCEDFTYPKTIPRPNDPNSIQASLFFPDEALFPGHPRSRTLIRNGRARLGKKRLANVPLFKDKNTPESLKEDYAGMGDDGQVQAGALPGHVVLDAIGQGMGICCLQVTFQACNVDEARFLYDQLAVMCPLMLALTAAAPIYRGYLCDVDCRWNVLSEVNDDRSDEEMGKVPLRSDRYVIPKSRYGSVDLYISPQGEQFNDVPSVYNEELCRMMVDAGIDRQLAVHMAHVFIRDPLVLYKEKIHQDDENETDHFENIQSSNWQTLRFKPPPSNSTIGWRVEFRPMETQLTDFENAAFVSFIVLLTRTIISLKLNLLVPISKVEENMDAAQKRDAVHQQKFNFRTDIMSERTDGPNTFKTNGKPSLNLVERMTMDEIFNGQDGGFPGLIPLIENYLAAVDLDAETTCTIRSYLQFISKKASGELLTTASWLRNFVTNHPEYKQDSRVSEKINYDLMKTCRAISSGHLYDSKLLCERAQLRLLRSGEKRRNTGPSNGNIGNGDIANGHNTMGTGNIPNGNLINGSVSKPVQEILQSS